jgi:hypothetical protein
LRRPLNLNKSECPRIRLCLMYASFEVISTDNLNKFQVYKNLAKINYRFRTPLRIIPRSVVALVIGIVSSILKTFARIVFGKHPDQKVNESKLLFPKAAHPQCCLSKSPVCALN